MLILAIDTALDSCAAAVLDTDANRLVACESVDMKRGHAEALMPLLDRVMKVAGLAFTALDRIAVTTGPGSFTGLRVGLSAARGLALAADKPVVGVTTLSAYAAPLVSENQAPPVISVIDARHDQVYLQAVSGAGETLIRPCLHANRRSHRCRAFRRASACRQRRAACRRPLAGKRSSARNPAAILA